MYVDDWLLYSSSREGTAASVSVVLEVQADMGFLVNLSKSATTPTQQLDWLGVRWDRAYLSRTLLRHQWKLVLGTLNFATPVLPLCHLRHYRLT